jgi:hypothetical protein
LSALLLSTLLASGATPGSHPASEGGSGERVSDREDLAQAFTHAAESIRRHQHPAGYWETLVTPGPVFENVTSEVNVFTPAFIVDLLGPVARDSGLVEVLDRARGYLRGQIEPTGLARYHGNTGPVDPSQRGCELPPDADDTALIWRIAPKEDPALLRAASRVLAQYRTDAGLYQTWLAGPRAYRCFYERFFPRDPNPPDVGIQMHVYLFLAKYDARAAASLCRALRQRMADDRIWVWYTLAPLLPLVREVDLAQAGCPVRVPDSRIEKAVPGQEAYLTQGRLFRDLLASSDSRPFRDPAVQMLRGLAAGGFETLSKTPPLLYHNALSALPPHYHWSEDAGYALWIRLYVETARRSRGALPLPIQPVTP